MKHKPYIIANWKLGLDHKQSIILAGKISNSQDELTKNAHIVACPSAISLEGVGRALGEDSRIELGVQNIFFEEAGKYTGETSIIAAKQLGTSFVIVGHSERRKHFHETNEDVKLKTKLTLKHKMIPIVCIGETYEERQAQQAEVVVTKELESAMEGVLLSESDHIMVAYEPIWAIGTGQAINPEQARMMGMVIHQKMIDMFSEKELRKFNVIYGGSVDSTNINDFVDGRILSGVLVGGASQDFNEFQALVKALDNNVQYQHAS